MNLSHRELLTGNRNFRHLLVAQYVSELGNWFNLVAGLGLVRLVSDASPVMAATLLVCKTLPFAVFAPIAGTFVDRFSRRKVMIAADLVRSGLALLFLLVADYETLWIAFVAAALISAFSAFFEGAKNASTPNITGDEGLMSGTALMFSSRFLLMALGAALGGWAASVFGYEAAFIINSLSFLLSAYMIWLIPEEAMAEASGARERMSFKEELREGIEYTWNNHFALTILMLNVIWAMGGGAINIIYDQLGGVYFASIYGWNPDSVFATFMAAAGIGLFLGMFFSPRIATIVDRKRVTISYIGTAIIIHGVLFAVAGPLPWFWGVVALIFVSRALIGAEYAYQEALFQRSLPDYIRGRISTIDRGAEVITFSVSSLVSGLLLYVISPQMLMVLSGLVSASAGVVWFIRMRKGREIPVARRKPV